MRFFSMLTCVLLRGNEDVSSWVMDGLPVCDVRRNQHWVNVRKRRKMADTPLQVPEAKPEIPK